MSEYVVGLDIGGTKLAAGAVDRHPQVLSRAQAATPAGSGPQEVLREAAALVRQVVSSAGGTACGLGVASAGVVDRSRGTIFSACDTIARWAGTPVSLVLNELTGLPTAVENDVNAIALAEAQFGSARQVGSTLVVVVGTGIGGAMVVDGRLWRGRSGTAGELGHIVVSVESDPLVGEPRCSCGRSGHLEAVAAGPAIASRWAHLTGRQTPARLEDVSRALGAGDASALTVVSEAGNLLGRALGGLSNLLDFELIVLSGGVLSLGEPFINHVLAGHTAEALPGPSQTRIAISSLGRDAGILGGALVAVEELGYGPNFFDTAPDREVGFSVSPIR